MRKQNSEFITAFSTEANQNLKNTDSFAFVELDDFACYVIADGIDDHVDAKSARLAVDTVIAAFTEAPSMSTRALNRYLNIANKALITAKSKRRLKASITIVVHNYVKLRYAQAGNTRFRLFRSGFLKAQSIDQSLSMDLVQEEKIPKDKLQKHQERNNLYCYLGNRKEFEPFISKKIKLSSTDAIALYTRGIWENVDDGEITDAFADASDKPQETVDTIEDLLLSKQPDKLEKFTIAVLFVNKTFEDPNKKRRIRKIIMIAIPILLIVAVLTIILVIRYNNRQEKIAEMNASFLNTIEYIQADNYIRAQEECKNALDLAGQVKDESIKTEASNHLKLIESIIAGDEKLNDSQYSDAQNNFLNAMDRARYADNLGVDYITDKLSLTGNFMSVYDLISLGDTLSLNLQYDKAEEKYLEAKALASRIYFDKGREAAMSALERLYSDMKALQEKSAQDTQQKAEDQAGAVSIMAQGDNAFAQGDYESALVNYTSALQKYNELGDTVQAEAAQKKIDATQSKISQKQDKVQEAETFIKQALVSQGNKDYVQAKKYFLLAKDIYARLKDDEKVAEITRQIEMLDVDVAAEKPAVSPTADAVG